MTTACAGRSTQPPATTSSVHTAVLVVKTILITVPILTIELIDVITIAYIVEKLCPILMLIVSLKVDFSLSKPETFSLKVSPTST